MRLLEPKKMGLRPLVSMIIDRVEASVHRTLNSRPLPKKYERKIDFCIEKMKFAEAAALLFRLSFGSYDLFMKI